MLRMNEGRFYFGINLHHLVAHQIDGLTSIVGTLSQHFGSTVGNLDIGGIAVSISHLERSAAMLFHNLIHAVWDNTHCHCILKDHILCRTNKDIRLATNPFLAGRSLNALGNIHIIVVSPRHTKGGFDF